MPRSKFRTTAHHVQFEGSGPSHTGSIPVPFAMNNTPVQGNRLVVRVVLLQAGCALLVASAFLMLRGESAGLAAVVGGLIVALGSAVFGWRMFAPGIAGSATLTRAMFAAVALKWAWLLIALYVALARWKLDAAPLLIGVVAAQLGHWAALIRLK
jgi:F0F1-type ATP synthase assembly protein I